MSAQSQICPSVRYGRRLRVILDLSSVRCFHFQGQRADDGKRPSSSSEGLWWSGWVAAGERVGTLELSAAIAKAAEKPFDLYFLCRTGENDNRPRGMVSWDSVIATISVNDTITADQSTQLATLVPLNLINQGILLTENPFEFPIFKPGNPTLLHPVPGKVALLRLAGAVPPGTKAVRAAVSVERAESHPIQFALWVRPSSWPATVEADFTDADAFSGWFPVTDQLQRHRFTVTLRDRSTEAMDLYLATRVVDYDDVNYCHAVWHELLILN